MRRLPERDVLGLHAGDGVGELLGLRGGQLPKWNGRCQLLELPGFDLLDRRGSRSLDHLRGLRRGGFFGAGQCLLFFKLPRRLLQCRVSVLQLRPRPVLEHCGRDIVHRRLL